MSGFPLCWTDPYSRIVARRRKTVRLGIVEFALFQALISNSSHQLESIKIVDAVYKGVVDLPADPRSTITHSIMAMNRKLVRLQLHIVGVNKKANSFYRLPAGLAGTDAIFPAET